MQELLQYLRQKITLSSPLQDAISAYFTKEIIPKNTILLKEYQYCQKLYFLSTGTVRTFYYEKGKDITSWFYKEDGFFTAWSSFYSQQASFEYIETLEDCQVNSITYEKFQQLLNQFPAFERFARLLAENQLVFIDQYSKGYMFLSAKERYSLLLKTFPDIALRVKLGHIASFLGISQETLSRIRAKK